MAKRRSEQAHTLLVRAAADHLRQNGGFSDIRADVAGYSRPEKITWRDTGRGHIPDLTANGRSRLIIEVETADSISHAHTQEQWTLFAACVHEHGREFWVVVPTTSVTAAQRRLRELRLPGKVWGI